MMGCGVGKSGSPTSMWMMSRPWASSSRARRSSSMTWKGWMSAMRRAGWKAMAILRDAGAGKAKKRRPQPTLFAGAGGRAGAGSDRQGQFEQLALEHQLTGQAILQLVEPFLVQFQFLLPGVGVDLGQGLELGLGDVRAAPVDVLELGHPAQRGFLGADAALDAIHDPLQHAHVLAETRP